MTSKEALSCCKNVMYTKVLTLLHCYTAPSILAAVSVTAVVEQWRTQEFFKGVGWGGGYARNFFGGSSTNSVEDRWQRERGSGGGSPLVMGSTQFANELNPYFD
jgi:hypothetical protein